MSLRYKHFNDTFNPYVTILMERSGSGCYIHTLNDYGISRSKVQGDWVRVYLRPINDKQYKDIEWHNYDEHV